MYWVVAALKTRRTIHRESFVARYGIMFLEVVGFALLFTEDASVGVLGRTVFPESMQVAILGVAFVWAGIALAIWARIHLGQFWSGRITLKEDHQLIRTGPYARLRHPIYSGLALAALGSAIFLDRWRCVAGLCVILLGFILKARREESLLAGQFGPAFDEHRRHTGFLLPRLR